MLEGDLSARERDLLVRQTEQNISAVQGVQDFYARGPFVRVGMAIRHQRIRLGQSYSVF